MGSMKANVAPMFPCIIKYNGLIPSFTDCRKHDGNNVERHMIVNMPLIRCHCADVDNTVKTRQQTDSV